MDENTDRIVYQLEGPRRPITLVYTGMGGPATANGLEMIAANGGRRVVVFGACGGVVSEIKVGDLIVVDDAVRGEGTSGYYAPERVRAVCDEALSAALWKVASSSGYEAVHRGKVFTTDAGYRQGPEIYDGRHGEVLGVECECAAAAIVATEIGLDLGALLFVTDNVTLSEDKDRLYHGLNDQRVRAGFEAGLDAVVAALTAG